MSQAYESTVRLSFDVRAGSSCARSTTGPRCVFLATIVLHLCRIFFTGAFRRPRELNWIIGVTLLMLAIFNGFAGYSLPDDLLSGTGLRIAYSIVLSVPIVGTWLAFLVFGGEFPATDIRHASSSSTSCSSRPRSRPCSPPTWRSCGGRSTRSSAARPDRGQRGGSRLWPTYAGASACSPSSRRRRHARRARADQPGLALRSVRPVRGEHRRAAGLVHGLDRGRVAARAPLRLHILGYRVSEIIVPAVIFPGLTFVVLFVWPAIDERLTDDRSEHHLLDRPRDRPLPTAFGVAVLAFYVILFVAGSQDLIAEGLNVSIVPVTWTLRIALLVVPLAAAALTYKICHDLAVRA